jgi:hypothetical protein
MRPWIIATASSAAAFAAAAALVRPELTLTPRSTLLPVLPTFAVTAIAVYGLCAIWLCAAGVITEIVSLRRHLDRLLDDHEATPWVADAVSVGVLRRLLTVQPMPAGPVVLRRMAPGEMRHEIVRLFYLDAARAQLFSALIVLTAIVVLGVAQQQGALPIVPGPIPTVAAALALAGLVLLVLLARIAIDVSAEPLIDAVDGHSTEATAAEPLRSTLARIEAAATQPREASPTAMPPELADWLVAVVEQSQLALSAASERLAATGDQFAATGDRFAATANASIAALAEPLRAGEMMAQDSGRDSAETVAAMAELRDAVGRLTAVLEHLRSAPAAVPEGAPVSSALRRGPQPDLADELRKLLQEAEAPP